MDELDNVFIQGVPRNMTVMVNILKRLLSSFVELFETKENNKNIVWQSSFSKIDFKVKIRVKFVLSEISCKKSLVSNAVHHYMEEVIQNYSPTVIFLGKPLCLIYLKC